MGNEEETDLVARAEAKLEKGERINMLTAIALLKGIRDELFEGDGDDKPKYSFSKKFDKSLLGAATCIVESSVRMRTSAGKLHNHYPPGTFAWKVADILMGGQIEDNDPTEET